MLGGMRRGKAQEESLLLESEPHFSQRHTNVQILYPIKDGSPVAPDQCDSEIKPFEEEDCNEKSCRAEEEEEGSGEGSGEEAEEGES